MSSDKKEKGEMISEIFSYLLAQYRINPENTFGSTFIASDLSAKESSVRSALSNMREQGTVEYRKVRTNTTKYLYRYKPPGQPDPLLSFGKALKQH